MEDGGDWEERCVGGGKSKYILCFIVHWREQLEPFLLYIVAQQPFSLDINVQIDNEVMIVLLLFPVSADLSALSPLLLMLLSRC